MRAWLKGHPRWSAGIAAAVGLFIGIGIGAASTDTERIAQLEAQVNDLEAELAEAEERADEAEDELESEQNALARRERELKKKAKAQRTKFAETRDELNAREEEISGAELEIESNTITDGTWEAGRDFEPGLYRAEGGEGCYWAKLNSADPTDIASNGLDENPTVQIDSPFFSTNDCGDWKKIG